MHEDFDDNPFISADIAYMRYDEDTDYPTSYNPRFNIHSDMMNFTPSFTDSLSVFSLEDASYMAGSFENIKEQDNTPDQNYVTWNTNQPTTLPAANNINIFNANSININITNQSINNNNNTVKEQINSSPNQTKRKKTKLNNNVNNTIVKNNNNNNTTTNNINPGPVIKKEFELIIEKQPPVEVRTRTPSENRTFSVVIFCSGNYAGQNLKCVEAQLVYAAGETVVKKKKDVLGGDLKVCVGKDHRINFTNLSICEASTKHSEQEFCIEFTPVSKDGTHIRDCTVRSTAFYAYSHMKVLARRKNTWLRTLNKSYGSFNGGDEMHVIGTPFIKGPSLKCVFDCGSLGKIPALDLEVYSDSVLFFRSPPYPDLSKMGGGEIKVGVLVTNDGRTYSNALEFVYVPSCVGGLWF